MQVKVCPDINLKLPVNCSALRSGSSEVIAVHEGLRLHLLRWGGVSVNFPLCRVDSQPTTFHESMRKQCNGTHRTPTHSLVKLLNMIYWYHTGVTILSAPPANHRSAERPGHLHPKHCMHGLQKA